MGRSESAHNLREHGVAFDAAREAFDDPFLFEWFDEREDYDEERFGALGVADGRLLYVAYTMRGGRIRIISARGAEAHEKRKYHEKSRQA
jgi:uncharacterized DUF497 family protein